ncbi:hypothetical protein [Streptomyces sp. MST-110588]|uniref:hypothetical protein n=1 Tax=Streptomyces sp. MST-110588 TaxID=2833628 RepID=UPI001F5CD50B|nr:hypothetical protein [Streptomyces sp. MST-110588]UNO42127.1 hypothetical protein KGS77_24720 [Streptomyces sp. MST-110588]
MGIELGRVLARLAESGGKENVALGEGSALDALGALSVVDPERVDCDAERLCDAVAG